jgi:hypothetical protein
MRNERLASSPAVRLESVVQDARVRQSAISAARRDHPTSKCKVYNYAEANLVAEAIKNPKFPCVANNILPYIPVDFVSYSAYDTLLYNKTQFQDALDYLQRQLKKGPNNGLGQRIFIGEFGFPVLNQNGTPYLSWKEQAKVATEVLMQAIAWGSPWNFWWEIFNNELTVDAQDRGFCLRQESGEYTPFFWNMRSFIIQLNAWARWQRPLKYGALRRRAVEILAKMVSRTAKVIPRTEDIDVVTMV